MTTITFPSTHFVTNGVFDPALLALQKQGRFTPKKGRVTVLLNNKTGDIAILPKGKGGSTQQVAVNDFSLTELEDLADKSDAVIPGDADSLRAAIMLLRPHMDGGAFYLFADSPNTIIVAPAPVKVTKGFA